jgi:hypothetical protein
MNDRTIAEQWDLIQPYFRWMKQGYLEEESEDFWAWEYVENLIEQDPQAAWRAILALIQGAPSKDALRNVGAGHLEDFLKVHITEFGDQVIEEASHNERLLAALRSVWLTPRYQGFPTFRKVVDLYGLNKRNPIDFIPDGAFSEPSNEG